MKLIKAARDSEKIMIAKATMARTKYLLSTRPLPNANPLSNAAVAPT